MKEEQDKGKLIRLVEKEREIQMKTVHEKIAESILKDIEEEGIHVKEPEKGKEYSILLTPIEYIILKNTTAPKLFRATLKRAGFEPKEELFIQVTGNRPSRSGRMPKVDDVFKEKPVPNLSE